VCKKHTNKRAMDGVRSFQRQQKSVYMYRMAQKVSHYRIIN